MCGIVTIWGKEDRESTETMMERMIHRGPDAAGTRFDDQYSLGHRRLSIMDPTGGDQPIANEDGRINLVANGEIYNFPTLSRELLERHVFTTSSDSEVVAHLFEDDALDAAKRLDGMFAFALTDGRRLYAARDTVGIKPLYHGTVPGGMAFASELKALVGLAENVKEFPPGHYYDSESGFKRFGMIPDVPVEDMELDDCLTTIRSTLERCVEKRLMSDVPLGAFLSGGLDSSLIAAMVRRRVGELHTFSVGLEGSRDLEAARVVAKHIDSVHHEHVITREEMRRHLPEIIFSLESFDQDLVRSAVPCFFVSRLAAEHVKVILTGEGADELFGGYAYYKDIDCDEALRDELYRSVSSLHNINLQRVDRLTMAHSIEGRVPFLDLEMIELGQRVPAKWKIRENRHGERVEKWALRKACEDLLPDEIVWRAKEQFDEGSGSADVLDDVVAELMSESEAETYRGARPETRLRGREEAAYHRLLHEVYPDPSVILANVARWEDDRIGVG